MGWTPELNPLVCPFCERACEFPSKETEPVSRKVAPSFDRDSLRASCGCGAYLLVDTEIHEDQRELRKWARTERRFVNVRLVRRVDFYGPASLRSEKDGEWVDALFYRLSPKTPSRA